MEYAVIYASGKQFLVKPGLRFEADFIKKSNVGDYILFNRILLIRNERKILTGKPFIEGIKILGKITQHIKSKKKIILKSKPKKNYKRALGVRTLKTQITIESL